MNRVCLASFSVKNPLVVPAGRRLLSAQALPSFKPTSDEYSEAKPFGDIPGPGKLEVIRGFLPGGKFHNKSMVDFSRDLRSQYGDFYRMPGLFGQPPTLSMYDPNDIEFMHRNEGAYPFRRGMQTMAHYRKNVRSDVYSVGGLIIE
jgi:cytochrome P450 family 12